MTRAIGCDVFLEVVQHTTLQKCRSAGIVFLDNISVTVFRARGDYETHELRERGIRQLTEGGCARGYDLVQDGGPMPTGDGSVGGGGGYGAIYCLALSQ